MNCNEIYVLYLFSSDTPESKLHGAYKKSQKLIIISTIGLR